MSKNNGSENRIYLDYAASTPVDPRVLSAMGPYWNTFFGNAGSIHKEGEEAKKALTQARGKVADLLKVRPSEIIFTSGGTESNNLAIFGIIEEERKKGRAYTDMHAITSSIEHPSVLYCFSVLERKGVHVSYVGVNELGQVDPKEIRETLSDKTVLLSIMYANNEIGTIEPLADIAKVVRKHRKERVISRGVDALPLVFHTDASQVPLFLNCIPTSLGVDLMTLDGQKVYGPKGIGLLYKKESVVLEPLLHGGSQEQGLRPGTEPVALIIGLTEALSYAISECEETASTVGSLRDYFIEQLVKEIPNVLINGDREKRIANNINVSIPNISGTYFVVLLDSKGIACGTRSACIGDSDEASYVLEALGRNKDQAKSSLRFSLGRETSKEEIDQVVQVLKELVAKFDN